TPPPAAAAAADAAAPPAEASAPAKTSARRPTATHEAASAHVWPTPSAGSARPTLASRRRGREERRENDPSEPAEKNQEEDQHPGVESPGIPRRRRRLLLVGPGDGLIDRVDPCRDAVRDATLA